MYIRCLKSECLTISTAVMDVEQLERSNTADGNDNKHAPTILSSHYSTKYSPKQKESIHPYKGGYMNIHSNFIENTAKLGKLKGKYG